MSDSTSRKLAFLIAGLLVLGIWIKAQDQKKVHVAAAPSAATTINVPATQPQLAPGVKAVAVPAEKCALTLTNGGTFALATPTACNGVTIASIKLGVSEKPCSESKVSDFQSVTSSTYYKGEFGFYLGKRNPRRCLVVQEIMGAI
ncbi:hypothetical protein KKP04_09560 [Rhodomicrobium sp. Az07]|uniref:hypothetical protein n=1 Tax=Rhodomicrobium sp. Az07 TaxID=2839034 RepID=UPI001BE53CF4|nr:hypothetical protein [Rhodomicrobium sp. Az07]MBT3071115.1 hypothetical protein [Rhodomicrobium sp. Az07]